MIFGHSTEVSNTCVYPSKRKLYCIYTKKPNPRVIVTIANHAYIIFSSISSYVDFRHTRIVGKSPVKSPYCFRIVSVYCCAPKVQRLAITNHHWTCEFRTIWSCYSELAGFCCVNSGFQEKNSKDCCSA